MKKVIYQFTCTLAIISLFGAPSLFAQSDAPTANEKTVIITIVTNDDNVIVKKKRIDSEDLPTDFDEFKNIDSDDIKSIDVKIVERSSSKKQNTDFDDKFFFFKKSGTIVDEESKEDMDELRERIKKQRKSWKADFGKCSKPLLGVYASGEKTETGVKLSSVMPGRGAADAGLQKGDIIVEVAGRSINSANDIGRAIKENKPGDIVKVTFIRDGVKKKASVELSKGRSYYSSAYSYKHFEKRDPCKVFIGVYTSSRGEGVKISGIIDDTPAADMDLQEGDIILAFDNVNVETQSELVRERNLNEPGDYFKLTILRDGKTKSVRGQFKSCDEESPELPEDAKIKETDTSTGSLEVFQVFPNPTFGDVNIKFEGEATPATVRVTDITGKIVFEDRVPDFDGYYNRQVQLKNVRPGNLSVSVIQNNRAVSKNIILLNRA